MFAGEKLRVSAAQSSLTCLLSIAGVAIRLPYFHVKYEQHSFHGRKYFAATSIQQARPGSFSQRRNGPRVRHMAARPFTLSQLWRYLAAQTNTFPGLFRLWFPGWVCPDRGDPAYL